MNQTAETPSTTGNPDSPGARLYYEVRGAGSGGAAARLADGCRCLRPAGRPAGRRPHRGDAWTRAASTAARSTTATRTPRRSMRADDVARLLTHLDLAPAAAFGSSGGAVTVLALAEARPDLVHTVIAHEPPLDELLEDREAAPGGGRGDRHRVPDRGPGGGLAAVPGRRQHRPARAGVRRDVRAPLEPQPAADEDFFFRHEMRPTIEFRPDLDALRTGEHADRGRHRRGVDRAGMRPDVDGARRRAGHRAGHLPRRPHRLRRRPRPVRRTTAESHRCWPSLHSARFEVTPREVGLARSQPKARGADQRATRAVLLPAHRRSDRLADRSADPDGMIQRWPTRHASARCWTATSSTPARMSLAPRSSTTRTRCWSSRRAASDSRAARSSPSGAASTRSDRTTSATGLAG